MSRWTDQSRADYAKRVGLVPWRNYRTAYGAAAPVADQLIALSSPDNDEAISATHDLWCGLSHQRAYISSAALPAFDFLVEAFQQSHADVQCELLEIFLGFAECAPAQLEQPWAAEVLAKMRAHRLMFDGQTEAANQTSAGFARSILERLDEATHLP